ncbi:fad binding domain-containing protein [Moniliophthora roreri MCA 2997]|uniref:Fad binding domain-containing protein n=1 Tax=Moniliophthora roreri (strain MCA 2997) TaxID=1381753 RepID=V2YHK3_MONRO|nr:fad binding domain-containing protein [Moniliophthora roreri MCA 2997]
MSAHTLEQLKQSLHGDIVTPSDHDYLSAISRWAINAARHAKVVAFVKDVDDISLALRYAKENKLSLATRGGGHNAVGASSAEDGLVIDLSRYMNQVRVDPARKLAYVQGGAVWKDVDEAAMEHGLATVGGTVNHTGVGGLVLGGGFGWLQGSHALSVDNLVEVVVVLSDGTAVTASDNENSELFWAVRGGGCNFGICAEFVFRLHAQRRTVFAGNLVFDAEKVEDLMKVIREWYSKASEKEVAFLTCYRDAQLDKAITFVSVFYNGTKTEGKSKFKAFLDLGPTEDTTAEIPYEMLNGLYNQYYEPGLARYMRGFPYDLASAQVDPVRKVLERLNSLPFKENNLSMIVMFEYNHLAKVKAVPNDAMALARHSLSNGFMLMGWPENTPKDMMFARKTVWEILRMISPGEKFFAGNREGFQYVEDQDHRVSSTNKGESLYGAEKYKKLQHLKRKYDPDVIFDKWFIIERRRMVLLELVYDTHAV